MNVTVRLSLLFLLVSANWLLCGCSNDKKLQNSSSSQEAFDAISTTDESGSTNSSQAARKMAKAVAESSVASQRNNIDAASARPDSKTTQPTNATDAQAKLGTSVNSTRPETRQGKQSSVSGATKRHRPFLHRRQRRTPYRPTVHLTTRHAESCLVQLGKPFPVLNVSDLNGDRQSTAQLYGDQLTLVVFWEANKVFAREQYTRLQTEVGNIFPESAVKIIPIKVWGTSKELDEIDVSPSVQASCLFDPAGEAFAQVATSKTPRSYLLDKNGIVVWFDLEYSETTRRQLRNAIEFHLQHGATANPNAK